MSEAMFTSFIKGHLRKASRWWKPITETLKKARVGRGIYLCNVCKQNVPVSVTVNGKKQKGVMVDHINTVINPKTGFTTWDSFILNLFCEEENLQAICYTCHQNKSSEERALAKAAKDNNKGIIDEQI